MDDFSHIPVPTPPPANYYTSARRKWGDFFMGLFVFAVGSGTILWLVGMFSASMYSLFMVFLIVIMIVLFIYFRRIGRRFIALGILMTCLLPVVAAGLLFGACLITGDSW